MSLRFRAAGPDDAENMALLHAASWRRHYRGAYSDAFLDGDVVADRRAVWSARLSAPSGSVTVVAEDDTGLAGFVHVVCDEDGRWGSLVDNLHVAQHRRRTGLGTALLSRAAGAVAERARGKAMYLWVLEQNTAAQEFYRAAATALHEPFDEPRPPLGTLALLGLVFGAAFVSQYRKLRRAGRGRRAALGEAFFSLLPPPIAEMVRHELAVWGILARAATFRTQAGPGETRLGRVGIGALPAAVAVLLAAGGVSLVVGVGVNAFTLVGGILLEYGAAAAAAFALAGRVRPHTVGAVRIILRWGTHQGVDIPLETVTGVETAPGSEAVPSESGFRVPGRAADALVLQLGEPVEVPARLGIMRPVTTVVVPVSNGAAARAAIAEHREESP